MVKKVVKENLVYLIILFVLTVASIIIMNSSIITNINNFDKSVINFVMSIVNDNLTTIFKIITKFGDIYIPLIIIVCIFLFFKNKWYFYLQTGSYLIAGILTYLSKILVGRERPLEALIEIPKSNSFPSGHTFTSIVFYLTLIYLLTHHRSKKIKIVSFVLISIFIVLIAFSRIYLGVHFCSDVIGGILFGIPCLLMILNIIDKNFKKKLKK